MSRAPRPAPVCSLAKRFGLLEDALNAEFVERRAEAHGVALAFAAGTTCVFLGGWGVAKSMLPSRARLYIEDAEMFSRQLSSFTTPERLFGPVSLPALQAGRDERVTDSTIVTADWVLLDEAFNAHKVLDELLEVVNERVYRNGTQVIALPWRTLFATSNEVPSVRGSETLYGRFFDRLVLRYQVQRVQDPASMVQLLGREPFRPGPPVLSWDDVLAAQGETARVVVPGPVAEAVVRVRQQLARAGVYPSDRRFVQAMGVVRAEAWLDGRAEVELGHLRVLSDVLWLEPSQVPTVRRAVAEVADPAELGMLDLLSKGADIIEQLDAVTPDVDLTALGRELFEKIEKANEEYMALRSSPQTSSRVRLSEARQLLRLAAHRVKVELYGIEAGEHL